MSTSQSQKFNETLNNLEDLGIYQLRELAREIGVHLPTTMRKGDLIQKIREIASGEAQPFVATTKKGRPPKQFQTTQTEHTGSEREYDYKDWGKSILPYTEVPLTLYRMSDNASFIFDERKYDTVFDVSGIVSIDDAGNARLHEGDLDEIGDKRIARIEFPVITKFGIRDGDKIEGRMGKSLKDGGLCLFDVKTINGKPLPLTRLNFADTKAMPVQHPVVLENMPITKFITPIGNGQRVLVQSKDQYVPKHFMHALADEFARKQEVLYITLDEQPEDYYSSEQQNLKFILCPFDLPVDKQLYILELALNRAKRLAEQGENIVVMIEDLITVARLYNRCYKSSGLGESDEFVIDSIKKLLACGRNVCDGGTVTLVCGVSGAHDATLPQDFLYETKKACNCFITLNTGAYFGVYDFDISASYTVNQDRMLSNALLQKAGAVRQECEGKTALEITAILNEN